MLGAFSATSPGGQWAPSHPSSPVSSGARSGCSPANRRCRSELCLEMSHLNEGPFGIPRSALIFRAQILGKSPSGRAKFNRKVRYPAGIGRVRGFVPGHKNADENVHPNCN